MLDVGKLLDILVSYKKEFYELWKDEQYKWKAIKCFQDNWNIEADDFTAMLDKSLSATANLLMSMHFYPRGMIVEFSKHDPEAVRHMFRQLFDESIDLEERLIAFMEASENIRIKYGEDVWGMHYQSANAISTYLWLKYPDKYYIYKYGEVKAVAKALGSDYKPSKGKPSSMIGGLALYDEIRLELLADKELMDMFRASLNDDCYPDYKAITLTIDFGYYVSQLSKGVNPVVSVETIVDKQPEETTDSNRHYWWLTANPKIWSFGDIVVDSLQTYTLYNDNGNKRRIFQNFLDAKKGDLIIGYESNPVKKVVALAVIEKENDGKQITFKKIESLPSPIEYSVLKTCPELAEMEYFKNSQGSLFKLEKKEFDFIMDMVREDNPTPNSKPKNDSYGRDEFLDDVYVSADTYDSMLEVLENKKNIILQGAPGVGKTYAARRLCYSIMEEKDDSRIEFVQFHQNYSYEDFVMGYRPDGSEFKLTEGIFYRFCKKAESDPSKKYFFLIDEINRGNMSKIFGELLMLLEKDYRDTRITMAYSGLKFSIPSNLYVIGMMNTADRSLAMIDYALRRRFAFIEMKPAFNSDGFRKYQKELDDDTFDMVIDEVKALNQEIASDRSLGKGFQIGHSYFCGATSCNDDWLKSVIRFDIVPMLSEYWFDELQKVEKWENRLMKVFDD